LAVNNLLQRDDEGDDPTDDEDPYMHGDDLISLLDINSHHSSEGFVLDSEAALFDEDSFRFTRRLTSGASSGSGMTGRSSGHSSSTMNAITDAIERESRKASSYSREQRWYDTYRDEIFSSSRYDSAAASSGIHSRHDSHHGTHHGTGHYHHSQYAQQPSHSSLHHQHQQQQQQRDVASLSNANLQTNESLGSDTCRKQNLTSNQMNTTFSFEETIEYWKENVREKFI
jgi:hypothetical protein